MIAAATVQPARSIAERNAIVEANLKLVPYTLRRLPSWMIRCLGGFDAAASFGYEGLLHAAQEFDPGRGKRFSTFACTCIHHQVYSAAIRERQRRGVRQALTDSDFDPDWLPDPESIVGTVPELLTRLPAALEQLPERLAFVVQEHADGKTFAEIAPALGVSKQRAQQLYAGALRRLRVILGIDAPPRPGRRAAAAG